MVQVSAPCRGRLNIPGISSAGRAAGADWINVEGTVAAIQGGWIQVCRMRCLKLLGRLLDVEAALKRGALPGDAFRDGLLG